MGNCQNVENMMIGNIIFMILSLVKIRLHVLTKYADGCQLSIDPAVDLAHVKVDYFIHDIVIRGYELR